MPETPRSMPSRVVVLTMCMAALVLACHVPGRNGAATGEPTPTVRAQVQPDSFSLVPASPPNAGLTDRVAREVYDPANIVADDSLVTGPFPRDMLWLWFQDTASQEQRQAAVDLISGVVVGGSRIRPGGVYYVRIHADTTTRALHRAIATLKTLPQVRTASVDLSLIMGSPQLH